ncbi:porphobilinogen deaminase [Aulographum hederae CBS 113979]|uniref:Porphobilinogen deaminase n=1 Tax=Aulographum hederae CBS 113979 TaxID=1176131 RepID=A0A6G1HEE6_9PEZI|nr:porphobilinogen deaminase [Aulographum hederae CBS 113979]
MGTRRSLLARKQTSIVEAALRKAWPGKEFEVHAMDATADKDKVTALYSFNAKSLWTHELEALLETGELDLIVHSLKDVPTQLPPNLTLGAIFPREDPRDALVIKSSLAHMYNSLSQLPEGSVIGTSSLRRTAQLKRTYPHLRFDDMRGNVGTRLSKLDAEDSQFAGLILAAAGLIRLDYGDRISAFLSKNEGGMLYAVGQGAIGVEIRRGDEKVAKLLEKVGCERTTMACLAERSLMRTLEGGCSVPIGVETEWVQRTKGDGSGEEVVEAEELLMRAMVISLDGQEAVETEQKATMKTREDADAFGREVARVLVELGAGKILEKINLDRGIVEAQGNA